MTTGVYTITNLLNGHQYVGSSSKSVEGRLRSHRRALELHKHHNQHLQNAWNKYGEVSFVLALLEEIEPRFCVSTEQFWITSLHPVYNLYPNARSPFGTTPTAETRAKISAAKKGKKLSPEHRARLSAIRRGRPTGRSGIKLGPHSLETRAKISAGNLGKVISKEHRAKLRAANLGKIMPNETRAKISAALLGRPAPNKGKKASEETRAKMSASGKARQPGGQLKFIHQRWHINRARFDPLCELCIAVTGVTWK